jgi:hypothetical protein
MPNLSSRAARPIQIMGLAALWGCTPEPLEIGCLYECVPEVEMPAGDPVAGRRALLNEGYVSCGFPASVHEQVPALFAGESLPEREGRNADVPYWSTVTTSPAGVEVINGNCLSCHAGYIDGTLVIGLGDSVADASKPIASYATLARQLTDDPGELAEIDRFEPKLQVMDLYVTDTIGMSRGDALIAAFAAHREPSTQAWSEEPVMPMPPGPPVPHDTPPWWGMKKKNAMFANTAVRGDYTNFILNEALMCADSVAEVEAMNVYGADIRAFLQAIEPPRWPGVVDTDLAAEGEDVFRATCAQCHGTYGDDWVYPNVVVPIEIIGTDSVLADEVHLWEAAWDGVLGPSIWGDGLLWEPQAGYVAPPLDGIWATAPYFHNGAVPTLAGVLESGTRPDVWRRASLDSTDYDWAAVGWNYDVPDTDKANAAPEDRLYIYDTSGWGYANTGHTFGDALSATERTAVIEYLKTL